MPRSSPTAPTSRMTRGCPPLAIRRTANCEGPAIAEGMDLPRALRRLCSTTWTRCGDAGGAARIAFEAVVGTDEGQVAVAPGRLRRTWTQGGRRYFHYATDVPIRDHYAFFSAAYAVHEGRWNETSIEIFHHPTHAWNVDRMVRSVQASLDYYTQQFGPYPHGQLRFVEHPGDGVTLHASPVNISYEEGFSLLNPGARSAGHRSSFRSSGA